MCWWQKTTTEQQKNETHPPPTSVKKDVLERAQAKQYLSSKLKVQYCVAELRDFITEIFIQVLLGKVLR